MRSGLIDSFKGFLILCVVAGHAVNVLTPDVWDNAFYNAVYSFHMPAFFILAGYLFKPPENIKEWFKTKAKRLLIPHFAFNLAYYPLWTLGIAGALLSAEKMGFGSWIASSTYSSYGEWFLWVMFATLALMLAFRKHVWIGILAVGLIGGLFATHILRTQEIVYYFPYVGLGYILAQKKIEHKRWFKPAVIICALAFIPVLYAFNWQGGFAGNSVGSIYSMGFAYLIRYPQAFVGAGFALSLAYILKSKPMSWLGANSLSIYLLSVLFGNLHFGSGFTAWLSAFITPLLASIMLIFIYRKIKSLKFNKEVAGYVQNA